MVYATQLSTTSVGHQVGPGSAYSQISQKPQVVAHPVFEKLGKMPTFRSCISAENYFHGVADLSMSVRNFTQLDFSNIDAAPNSTADPFMGLASAMYFPIGLGELKDAYKQTKIASKIGDDVGFVCGAVQMAKKAGLAMGGALLGVDRIATVCGKTSSAAVGQVIGSLFGVYYLFSLGMSVVNIVQLQRLLKEFDGKDAIDVLKEKLKVSDAEVDAFDSLDFYDEAVNAGSDWLTKVFKEFNQENLKEIGSLSGDEKKLMVKQLFYQHPEYLQSYLGYQKTGSPQELMIAFGREVKRSKLLMKKEEALSRIIGKELLEKVKGGTLDHDDVIEEIEKMKKSEFYACILSIIGAVASFLGLSAMGIPNFVGALLWAVSGIGWFFHSEGLLTLERLMGKLTSPQVGKYDKWIILSSILLNAVAIIGSLVTFGNGKSDNSPLVSLVLLVGVGLFWAAVSIKAVLDRQRYLANPWEVEKVPSLRSFHKLVISTETDEKVKEIYAKLRHEEKAVIQLVQDRQLLATKVEKRLEHVRKASMKSLHYLHHVLQDCAAPAA